MEETRKIIHVDMDAFYASVEQRDHPELRGLPLAVGGTGERGVIATASYEARKYGIHSAMPSRTALRKCPFLLFTRPRFDVYREVSSQIHEIFHRYTSKIEPLSLDEAYLDVTYSKYELQSATLIAQQIKNDIQNELNLVASAGVSYNKFLAKIASDQDKPDGLFIIPPENGPDFIKTLPIEDFFGVGKVTAKKLMAHGIFKGGDLLPYKKWELQQLFGKHGVFLYQIARGIDDREVKSTRVRKSVGVENTFSENIVGWDRINEEFTLIFESWWERYQSVQRKARTLTVKVRNNAFETITRSHSEPNYITDKNTARSTLVQLLKAATQKQEPLRLLGVSISGFEVDDSDAEYKQLTIW